MSRDARKQVFVVPEQVGHIAACIFPERVILAIMYTDHTYIAKQKISKLDSAQYGLQMPAISKRIGRFSKCNGKKLDN